MREQIVKVYKFEELSEKAQEKALEKLSDINVDYDWWDSVYDDAKNAKLRIGEFDTYRRTISIEFLESAEATAHLIIDNHGKNTATYKTAENYLKERDEIIDTAERDKNGEFVSEYELDKKLDEIDAEFLREIGEDYLSMLISEYEYRTGREAIIETIDSNEYEFTEDGKLFN